MEDDSPFTADHSSSSAENSPRSTEHSPGSTEHSSISTEHSPRSTEHSPRCTEHSPGSTEHSSISTEHSPRSTEHSPRGIEHSSISTEHSPRSTEHSPRSTEHSPRGTEHSPRSTEHSPRSAEHSSRSAEDSPRSTEHSSRSAEHSPRSAEHSPIGTEHSPRSTEHSPISTEHSPRSTEHSPISTEHSPRSTEHSPRSTNHGGHVGSVDINQPYSFLTAPRASTGSSSVDQEDVQFSVNSNFLHHAQDDENNESSPIDGDILWFSEFDKLPGRQDGIYSASYPTQKASGRVDVNHLEQLVQATSHMKYLLSEGVRRDNNSHSTNTHPTVTSLHGKAGSEEKNSHITDHYQAANSIAKTSNISVTNTAKLSQKTHPRNWVSFEEEDENVENSNFFTVLNHHQAKVPINHVIISDPIKSSRDRDLAHHTHNHGNIRLGSRPDSSQANVDVLDDLQLVVNTASIQHSPKQSSVPVSIHDEGRSEHKFRPSVVSPASYTDSQHPILSVNSEVTEKDASLLQHRARMLLRPHSVDIPMHCPNETYDFTSDIVDTSRTGHHTRAQFLKSYKNSKYFSVPEDSNLKPTVKECVETTKKNEKPTIFRTSSSASLQGDNFISTSPPIAHSREPWKKTLKWISVLMDRKGTPAHMPIDDSMDFGLQPSLSQKDKVINAERKSFKPNSVSPDDKASGNLQEDTDTVIERGDADRESKAETKTAVYKKRWYLLFLFSLSAMLWNAVWSTWGPIAQSAKDVYGWSDSDIAMFIWLGNIPFLLTMFPCSYLMDVKGMRIAMIVACTFMFLGTGFRCIPSDVSTATWLIRMGQFLNGMAGTIPNSAPALLSGLWFPPNQRASATAISTVAGYLGASVSFVIGPLLVPQPNDLLPVNNTDDVLSVGFDVFDTNNMTNVTTYDAQENGIMHILYGEFAVASLLLLLVLIYFPSKPPLPPSMSASLPREKYIPGLKMLLRNKQFWVCAIAFSVPAGVYEAWQVILDVILDDKGVSQQTAGWLDFYATVGGCVSGLLVSRFADFFTRQMKLFLLIFYFFAAVSILWFTLVVFDILPFDRVSMYAAIIIAGVFLDGGGPLFFELTIEVSYPVGEGVTSGFTQMLCAMAGIIFLSVVQVESLGKEWINWYFFACVAMAIPLLFFITTTYGRADLDDAEEEEDEEEEIQSADTDEKTYLFGSSHV